MDRLLPKMPVRLGPMAKEVAKGANIRRQSRAYFCQRVEESPRRLFHLKTGNSRDTSRVS